MAFYNLFRTVLTIILALSFSSATPTTAACDRTCLLKIMTVYTDAISTKNTSSVPLSPSAKITNNGNITTLGTGLIWQTPGSLRLPYRNVQIDIQTGSATLFALITNVTVPVTSTAEQIDNPPAGQWWYFGLRLKIANQQITEIEELASTIGIPGTDPSTVHVADRIWSTYIPPHQQSTRDELAAIADSYWSTVAGQLPWEETPFHPECQRFELGTQTTNAVFGPGSCGTEFLAPELQGGTVTNRRIYVVDEDYGIVFGIAWFGGPNSTAGDAILEGFKIQDGLIRFIEAWYPLQGQSWAGWGEGPGCCPPST
jgi:hypothetical protein